MGKSMKKYWLILGIVFLAINTAGLVKIISLLEQAEETARVTSFAPQDKVDVRAHKSITSVRFNKDMVDEQVVGKDLDWPAIEFRPHFPARFWWADQRTLRFTPTENLTIATEYTAIISSYFIPSDRVYTFRTPRLVLVSARQIAIEPHVSTTLALQFNDAISLGDLLQYLEVQDQAGHKIHFVLLGVLENKTVRVKIDSGREDNIKIILAKGLRGASGPLGLNETVTHTVKLRRSFSIGSVYAYSPEVEGKCTIRVDLSTPVSTTLATKFISIEPPARFHIEPYWDGQT